jgi:hypothetical protein
MDREGAEALIPDQPSDSRGQEIEVRRHSDLDKVTQSIFKL